MPVGAPQAANRVFIQFFFGVALVAGRLKGRPSDPTKLHTAATKVFPLFWNVVFAFPKRLPWSVVGVDSLAAVAQLGGAHPLHLVNPLTP